MTGFANFGTKSSAIMRLTLMTAGFAALTACRPDKVNVDDLIDGILDPDADGDGFTVGDGDCDDDNASINPAAEEICDGLDNDCNMKVDNGMLTWGWVDEDVEWKIGPGVASLNIEVDDKGWESDDYMADGIADEKHLISFNSEGQKIQHDIDESLDGDIDFRISYSYNANGQLSVEAFDRGANGSVEKQVRYTYDAEKRLNRIEVDIGSDGEIDSGEIISYTEDGQLASHEFDTDGDGVADGGKYHTYDVDGKVLSVVDTEGDEQLTSKQYTYSEDGELLFYEIDSDDDDNLMDTRHYVTEDRVNNLKVIEVDRGINDEIDEIHTHHFDNLGRLRKIEKDYDINGVEDATLSLVYGDEGLVVMEDKDLLSGNEESFEASHVGGNRWESTRTIDFGSFEGHFDSSYVFTCEESPDEI